MKGIIKKIVITLFICLVGIQFFPTSLNQDKEVLSSSFTQEFRVSKNIQSMLKTSCYDCHSNNTNYPWYNRIQPISWILEHHIEEAKEELNFSEFGLYSKRKQKNKLKSIISQIKKDEMPLSSYTFIHNDAKLSKKDKEELIEWINTIKNNFN